MAALPTLRLKKELRRRARLGHPWIYDRALAPTRLALGAGQVVRVADPGGPLGVGYVDPDAPIRVRLLDLDAGARIDRSWVQARAQRAAVLRSTHPRLCARNALRVIHGEADGMPGLVIDAYAGTGLVRWDGQGARALWRPHIDAVFAGISAGGVLLERLFDREEGVLIGDEPPKEILIDEAGARFAVDVRGGHKTGWFLDQYENRLWVRARAKDKTVLDLFSYAGGFAVHAGLGGARRVTCVDQAKPAAAAARANLERNGLAERGEVVQEDVFAFLEGQKRRFELVVCDPPSFAPSERSKKNALEAYERLNRAALSVCAPDGLLFTASCSSHVTADDLRNAVARAAADDGRRLRIIGKGGAGPDHPILPGFPEGDYLSLFCCALG